MKRAAKAGPAMLQADCMIWLIPAIRINSDLGASKGMEAYIAGIWKAEPAERRANKR